MFGNLEEETQRFDRGLREGAKRYDKELFNDYTQEKLESFPEEEDEEEEEEEDDNDESDEDEDDDEEDDNNEEPKD